MTTFRLQPKRISGFTLTELVMVIVILGIISAVIVPLIGNKFSAVSQSTLRAKWVQDAEFALFHIRQDVAQAVPNSLLSSEPSSGDDQLLELLAASSDSAVYAARYRNQTYNPYNRLQPNNDASFDLFGSFANVPSFVSIGANNASTVRADWEALRAGGSNGVIAKVDTSVISAGENGSPRTTVSLTASHNFGGHSPYFRAYFSDGPVGYFCDIANNQLLRISGYNDLSGAAFSARSGSGSSSRNRIIDNLIGCKFSLSPSSTYLPPTLRVSLEIGEGSESIQLIDTIQLSNGS